MIPEHLLQVGDVILVSGKGLVSRCIKWCTDSKWSHAAVYVGGGNQSIVEAAETGVRVASVQTLVKGHTDVCVLRRPGLTVEQAELIKAKAYDLTYHPYDFVQLVTMGVYSLFAKVGIKWSALVRNSRYAMICSEVVAVCYQNASIDLEKKVKMVSPASLYSHDGFNIIYQAKL